MNNENKLYNMIVNYFLLYTYKITLYKVLIQNHINYIRYTVCLKKNYTLLKWRPNKKYSILGGKDYMYG